MTKIKLTKWQRRFMLNGLLYASSLINKGEAVATKKERKTLRKIIKKLSV